MPFGKYQGRSLCEIPTDYLEWLLAETNLRESLRFAVEAELNWRRYSYAHHGAWAPLSRMPVRRGPAEEIVDAGVRACARKYHPDIAGGDLAKMQDINIAVEWSRGQCFHCEGSVPPGEVLWLLWQDQPRPVHLLCVGPAAFYILHGGEQPMVAVTLRPEVRA